MFYGRYFFSSRIIWEQYNHIIDIYFLKIDFDINKLILQKTEVIDIKLISKEKILELVKNMDYRSTEYREIVIKEIKKL